MKIKYNKMAIAYFNGTKMPRKTKKFCDVVKMSNNEFRIFLDFIWGLYDK